MQSIMNTFHSAMKIRKYLRLSKNSRMLSPAKPESMVHEAVTELTTKHLWQPRPILAEHQSPKLLIGAGKGT